MQVRVLFFGVLKDLAGRSSDLLSLPDHARAADVISHYEQGLSANKGIFNSIAISVNQEYVRPEMKLKSGDEIALLPPVSGGAPDQPTKTELRAFITHEEIDTAGLLEIIRRPEDGAAIVFEGVVRNHSRGRRTLFLEYEAYEEMALKQLESLIAESRAQFQIRDAAIIHRLGKLEIGETSVVIVVVSAHRSAAFEACRWLIDTLKRTVPIWKKEHFEDGAIWSDGEPFPDITSTGARAPVLSEAEGSSPVQKPVLSEAASSPVHQQNTEVEVRAPSPVHRENTEVEARASSPVGNPDTDNAGSHSGNSASKPVAHK